MKKTVAYLNSSTHAQISEYAKLAGLSLDQAVNKAINTFMNDDGFLRVEILKAKAEKARQKNRSNNVTCIAVSQNFIEEKHLPNTGTETGSGRNV